MVVIAHHSIGVDAAGKDFANVQNALFDPGLSVFETPAEVVVKAAQPGAPHAASDAVATGGVRGIDEGSAGLGHGGSFAVLIRIAPRKSLRLD